MQLALSIIGTLLLLLVALGFGTYRYQQAQYKKINKPYQQVFLGDSENMLPSFDTHTLPVSHQYTALKTSMPFLDTKLINPYDDDRVAIIQTGGEGQDNSILLYADKQFEDITQELNLGGIRDQAAYSIAYVDIDNDGTKEILIGYESGIYLYRRKTGSFAYQPAEKLFDVPDASIPVHIAVGDSNNNGYADLFVSTFVDRQHFTSATYHDNTNKRRNLFMVNNGDGTFTDQTEKAGLGYIQNTYLGQFIDINGNGLQDLVVAMNTDKGVIYENLGDGTFKPHTLPTEYGFWMGLSIEKLDNETDKYSILMSNIGKTFPVFMVRGDLQKEEVFNPNYALLEQVEGFEFKNVTEERNVNSNVFGWGTSLVDLNNNGRKDAILTENYIKFPGGIHKNFPSKGKVFFQHTDGTFAQLQDHVDVINPHFGYRVITHDFTANGFQDIIIGNVDGPIMFFENKGI